MATTAHTLDNSETAKIAAAHKTAAAAIAVLEEVDLMIAKAERTPPDWGAVNGFETS